MSAAKVYRRERIKRGVAFVATAWAIPSAALNQVAGNLWIAAFNLVVMVVVLDAEMRRRANFAANIEYLEVLRAASAGKLSASEFEAYVRWYRGVGPNPGP